MHRMTRVVFRPRLAGALFAVAISIAGTQAEPAAEKITATSIIDLSRSSAVEIMTGSKRLGTGFLIGDTHVATAFHVVAVATPVPGGGSGVNISYVPDLKLKLSDGEVLEGECVSPATDGEPTPYQHDFAVVRLRRSPKGKHKAVSLRDVNEKPPVGEEIYFSGYPLSTRGMVTHRGMVSGADDSATRIFLQAALNKGNSGGAVLTASGKAVGIISQREGEISQGLQEVQRQIREAEQRKDVQVRIEMRGIDPLQSTRDIIATLDRYISTGIGYAVSIKFLREYLSRHPEILAGK